MSEITRLICLPFREVYRKRDVIVELVRRDFKTRYLGSYLGLLWTFLHPLLTLLIFWFVFAVGLRAGKDMAYPYVLFLLVGLVPWFFVSEATANSMNAITEKAFLITNMRFRASFLPMARILCSLGVHLVFLTIVLVMLLIYRRPPGIQSIQIIYYLFAAVVLMSGLSFATAAVTVFVRDLRPIVTVLLQFLFWMTPIIWPANRVPAKWQWLMKANPVEYIITGYRNALIDGGWFWDKPIQTLYFWCLTITVVGLGTLIFYRLRPHFADVL